MLQQFYRTSILLGEAKINQLSQIHVMVAGVGGVGGLVVEALARAGIGEITLIDNDKVDITNLNRQIIATLPTVGENKVTVFKERIKQINPQCKVNAINAFINEENLPRFIYQPVDYVIDCIDTVPSKLALISYCVTQQINICSSMGAGNRYDVQQAKLNDISKTKGCSLARIIRLGLKKRGITRGVTVAYSEEVGKKPLVRGAGLRPINGTISYLPGLFGLLLAGHVIKSLIDKLDG